MELNGFRSVTKETTFGQKFVSSSGECMRGEEQGGQVVIKLETERFIPTVRHEGREGRMSKKNGSPF